MCGIFGLFLGGGAGFPRRDFKSCLDRLYKLSESRGKEASGLVMRAKGEIRVLKRPIPASRLIRSREYSALFNGSGPSGGNPEDFAGPLAVVGHSRLVTNGSQERDENNQPVTYGPVTGVHNGIVVNVDEIWSGFPELTRKCEVDTESLMALIANFREGEATLAGAVKAAFETIEGAASVATLFADDNKVALATNTGSLYLLKGKDQPGLLVFGSEAFILRRLIESSPLGRVLGQSEISQIKPGQGVILDLDDFSLQELSFRMNSQKEMGRAGRDIPLVKGVKIPSVLPDPGPKPLRRCTRCILPETMPFIEFDEDGVCNYCRDYRPMHVKGLDELEKILSPHRKDNGEPDCVVGFSGGRDSSYCLHLLKTKLGMNPIALTYDWGMVTDLARRNQARVCGKLGIEHVLVSADIEWKRKNIRKNVQAWLKQPEMGMIPLFMAGDKQFYYYARELSRQTGVKLVVISINPLEYSYFKYGFAGVSKSGYYRISLMKKLKLLAYYLSRYAKNPRYLNESLLDSAWAFASSFVISHDYYASIFDYVRWDEDEINKVLIREYDWETAKDLKSTWRIGDGTAPFYNYIYHKAAGFTENDTFRSNQIREGIITRDEGLVLAAEDNKPRWDSIREYLDLIGLPFDETIRAIDSIPTLY